MSRLAHASARSATPWIASSLLAFALPDGEREAVLGDLEEGLRVRTRSGSEAAARRWYRNQAIRSVWPALTLHADRQRLGRLIGAVFLGFATMWIVGDLVLIGSRAGYSALFPSDPSPELVLRLTYLGSMIPTCLLAGLLAARSGGSVGRLAAVTLGALLIVPVLVAPFLSHGGDPLWARLVWVFAAPTATLVGSTFGTPLCGEHGRMKIARLLVAVVVGYLVFAGGLSGLVISVWHEGWVHPVGVWIAAIVLALVLLGCLTGVLVALVGGELGRVATYVVAGLILVVTLMNIRLDVALEPLWFKLCVIGVLVPSALLASRTIEPDIA